MSRPTRRWHIRFVSQETVSTRSDHEALFVHVRIFRGRRAIDLTVVTHNLGNATETDIRRVLTKAGPRAVVLLQEASDRQDMLRDVCDQLGWTYNPGTRLVGQAATPVLTGPDVETKKRIWRRVLARTYIGPGAGPTHNKTKWWGGGRYAINGLVFGASSAHIVPSQQNARRQWAALRQAAAIARAATRRAPWFTGMDTNAIATSRTARYFYARGFTDNRREGGPIATRIRRSIDAVMWRRRPRPTSRTKKESR